MATASDIINAYTYTTDWKGSKDSNKLYLGDNYKDRWNIDKIPTPSSAPTLIDVDRYWNMYNVVSPRVSIGFYKGKDANDKDVWLELNGTNNNNFFVSATIEDTGYRQLTLELFDRTFTTIQDLLYVAVKNSTAETQAETVNSGNSNTFDLKFVNIPNSTHNNIRIRYGYNDNFNQTVKKDYWKNIGISTDSGLYSHDDNYRWVSRTSNDKNSAENQGIDWGESGETNLATTSNISTDKVLYMFNNQSTILGGYEEFYITNYQSTLTNTGIKYTINAVGNDAMKLNGYKFVQKYANIVDKPKNVLAALMKQFNYNGTGSNVTEKNSGETFIKILWYDDRDLVEEKKIVKTESGYKSLSSDEQRATISTNKNIIAGYNKRISVLKSLLGTVSSQSGESKYKEKEYTYSAGDVSIMKNLNGGGWKITKDDIGDDSNFSKLNSTIINTGTEGGKKAAFLYCYSDKNNSNELKNLDEKKKAFLAYWLKLNAEYYINTDSNSLLNSGGSALADNGTNGFYKIRLMRYGAGVTASDDNVGLYDFSQMNLIEKLNSNFKGKAAQIQKVTVLIDIYNAFMEYFKKVSIINKSGEAKGVHTVFPKAIYDCLINNNSKMFFKSLWEGDQRARKTIKKGLTTNVSNTDEGFTFDNKYMYSYYSEATGKIEEMQKSSSCLELIPSSGWVTMKQQGKGAGFSNNHQQYVGRMILDDDASESDMQLGIESIENLTNTDPWADPNTDFTNFKDYYAGCAIAYALGYFLDLTKLSNDDISSTGMRTCFDFAYNNQYGLEDNISYTNDTKMAALVEDKKYIASGSNIENISYTEVPELATTYKQYFDNSSETIEAAYDELKSVLQSKCTLLRNLTKEQSSNNENSWSNDTIAEVMPKIIKAINEENDEFKNVKENNVKTVSGEVRVDYGEQDARNNNSCKENYIFYKRLDTLLYKDPSTSQEDYYGYMQDISESIKKLNNWSATLSKKTQQEESSMTNDEITLNLGSSDSGNSYKSISSLLNEFCAACPAYKDYEAEVAKKNKNYTYFEKTSLDDKLDIVIPFDFSDTYLTFNKISNILVEASKYKKELTERETTENETIIEDGKEYKVLKNEKKVYEFLAKHNFAKKSGEDYILASEKMKTIYIKSSGGKIYIKNTKEKEYTEAYAYQESEETKKRAYYIIYFEKNTSEKVSALRYFKISEVDGSEENDIEYTDEEGNKQQVNITQDVPSYSLTWDIIGTETNNNKKIPIIGIHYRKPIKPYKLRVYKWGTGNKDAHVIKSLSISASSEFALLSSAANNTYKVGKGGEKIALKGTSSNSDVLMSKATIEEDWKKEYANYRSSETPAMFKSIVSESDGSASMITDAMFQAVNKGSITVLGDPSLRFGGAVSPYMFPIYIDISLQNEGKSWSSGGSDLGTKSQLSGTYVVSKITHNINQQGYTTTMEVMRYYGIDSTVF